MLWIVYSDLFEKTYLTYEWLPTLDKVKASLHPIDKLYSTEISNHTYIYLYICKGSQMHFFHFTLKRIEFCIELHQNMALPTKNNWMATVIPWEWNINVLWFLEHISHRKPYLSLFLCHIQLTRFSKHSLKWNNKWPHNTDLSSDTDGIWFF